MAEKRRIKVFLTGLVQGVGFRPFVYRIAKECSLTGYVLNSTIGVVIEAEGEEGNLIKFLEKLQKENPPLSRIFSLEYKFLPPAGYESFEIKESDSEGEVAVSVLPDIATCKDCLRELFDPKDRRYRYPFINCTNCGPRFTIIEKLPYDRQNTSMKSFKMCEKCYAEYTDPSNRRFHAQPNACPVCGPHVTLYTEEGKTYEGEKAIKETVRLLSEGKILAIKGLGGFHLICDATNEESVKTLRVRKRREEKPFAVMFPSLESVKLYAEVSPLEERALTSVETPIVILKRKENTDLAPSVSPDTSTVGAFLPYTPLHHIILRDFGKPIVATSCNLTDEPIMKDNEEAIRTLGDITDAVLVHNRPIVRRCDDSVVRVFSNKQVPVRRSRGFAPLPVILPFSLKRPVLAVGVHMKNTVTVAKGNRVYLSQHIGDVDNPLAESFFEEVVEDMLKLFDVEPEVVVSDAHPGYYSTKFAEKRFSDKLIKVYHHHSHVISCMAENELPIGEKVIGLSFDGTGYGVDGSIWGGEFLVAGYTEFERAFHLKYFRLPGGDRAVKEPYRVAVSVLMEAGINPSDVLNVDIKKISFISQMVEKGVNSPKTSSMGRLFDAVAAILGIRYKVSYHAQAAILLEEVALHSDSEDIYPFELERGVVDWRPIVRGIVSDFKKGVAVSDIAKKFHNTVVAFSVEVVRDIRNRTGIDRVALSGGVFQNRILSENIEEQLQKSGFTVLTHQVVPPNDAGISLGQAVYGGLIEKDS
ncbi:Hydrogenase maturation protein, carbamoyltransferase HypF [Desulfurobacterium pacificum]|uniref:Carbamoyltransferase n=1 Tax=Desulfurobacterium pacificum TaxID=240166 RepID=A0ABY1NC06_9BACT|nr:carbamoyltransferase HypF [Desulfurobacterium pacificum]SMP06038.1 Hydrogenase maturation protein, carbamoyltransferase HypF [Desulfurobacterium pacificum]